MINTALFRPWNLLVISTVVISTIWIMQRVGGKIDGK